MHNNESVTFAGGTLDRAAHLRSDADALAKRDDARALVLWHSKPLINVDTPSLAWLPMDAGVLSDATEPPIFLGLSNGAPRFAYDISGWLADDADAEQMAQFLDQSRNQHPALPDTQQFVELRSIMADLSHADAGDAATAKGIFEWHSTHSFCSNCGPKTNVSQAGWQRECPVCERKHFPRTDPVVIMLVTNGNDILLGRSPFWPDGMYSLLAGYMEPGECVEEAVRREVFEETGVTVGAVEYLASQPWPFPSSLMIGCHAHATSRDLTLDPVEIEDAKWISREALANAFAGND
ncbi:MAG: NAD(+) diphosphatase, partial [Alphaproteobacteria bacterium]